MVRGLQWPMVCIGDQNCLWDNSDYKKRSCPNYIKIRIRLYLLNEAQPNDISFRDPPFTWSNGQFGRKNIRQRLDRAAANGLWHIASPEAYVEHMQMLGSEHIPIMLHLDQKRPKGQRKSFRFEWFWINYDECKTIIEQIWDDGQSGHLGDVDKKLRFLTSTLRHWNTYSVGNI